MRARASRDCKLKARESEWHKGGRVKGAAKFVYSYVCARTLSLARTRVCVKLGRECEWNRGREGEKKEWWQSMVLSRGGRERERKKTRGRDRVTSLQRQCLEKLARIYTIVSCFYAPTCATIRIASYIARYKLCHTVFTVLVPSPRFVYARKREKGRRGRAHARWVM